jgi:hypothetical protein
MRETPTCRERVARPTGGPADPAFAAPPAARGNGTRKLCPRECAGVPPRREPSGGVASATGEWFWHAATYPRTAVATRETLPREEEVSATPVLAYVRGVFSGVAGGARTSTADRRQSSDGKSTQSPVRALHREHTVERHPALCVTPQRAGRGAGPGRPWLAPPALLSARPVETGRKPGRDWPPEAREVCLTAAVTVLHRVPASRRVLLQCPWCS